MTHCKKVAVSQKSKNLQRYGGAGLRISKGMMMMRKIVPTSGSDRRQPMVGQSTAEVTARCREGIKKFIVRVIHQIYLKSGPKAALIETAVVRHQGKPFDHRLDLFPYIRKHRRFLRILRTETVHVLTEPLIVLRLRMYQAIETIRNLTATDHDKPYRAYAARTFVGSLEIYGCKIIHCR